MLKLAGPFTRCRGHWTAIATTASAYSTRLKKNEFGDIQRSEVRLEKLIMPRSRNMDEIPVKREKIHELSLPLGIANKRMQKLKEKQEFESTIDGKKVIIECSRSEFNHVEGFQYPRGVKIPLATEFWAKNKYKDYWIKIHPITKTSFSHQVLDERTWDDYVPDKLIPQIRKNINKLGFNKANDVQLRSLSSFDTRNHLFIASETGSGKTLAYGAPLLTLLLKQKHRGKNVRALILVVTQKLRGQTYEMLTRLSDGTNLNIEEALKTKDVSSEWDVLVSTPGLAGKWLNALENPSEVTQIVMDEADMILDESFTDSLTDILSIIPVSDSETNTLNRENGARITFCSATCPPELECLAEAVVDREKLSYIKSDNLHSILNNVKLMFMRIREVDKIEKLEKCLQWDLNRGSRNETIVFCKDRTTAAFVHRSLVEKKYSVWLYGLGRKPDGTRIIIATDVASRGLDLPNLSHVINYDMARHMVDFIHRMGRVGRLSSVFPGRVTSFVRTESEIKMTNAIELAARLNRPLQRIECDVSATLRERKEKRDMAKKSA